TVDEPYDGVSDFELDLAGSKLYWIEQASTVPGASRIVRADMNGANVEPLVTYPIMEPAPRGLALDVLYCQRLFWILSGYSPDARAGHIHRSDLDGAKIEGLFRRRGPMLCTSEPTVAPDGHGCGGACATCAAFANPAQTDAGGDGIGDACPVPRCGV